MKIRIPSESTIFLWVLLMAFYFLAGSCQSEIITYPAPPGLITSQEFTVKANATPVWVEKIGSEVHTDKYSLYGGIEMEFLNMAGFSCSGPVKLTITAAEKIDSFTIRPKSRNIQAEVRGNELSFKIEGPQKLYIEINHLPHLAVIANPPEDTPPDRNDPNVVWYGPGIHEPGEINLQSDQTIYIAGGALVKANVRGRDLRNVKILGRGILQGNVRISNTSNLEVDGLFIRNTRGWCNTLTNCDHTVYRNVKVFGYEAIYSTDGINPVGCRNFTIEDCFMRCRDDCVAIKSNYDQYVDSVTVENCVMVGWACSDGVTMGFELNGGPVQNVMVRNCDILYARSGGMTGGHSGFSIVCDGPALVRNISFENIRIEENIEYKNLELIITDGKAYGDDPPGRIQGVHLKNISWENTHKPFIINGFSDENLVEDITFDHCYVGKNMIGSIEDADFQVNEFVRDIKFITD